MRKILLICFLISPLLIIGVTREVSLDGQHQYTSIQTAIDACSNGDIVQVYPGEYFEHLNTNGHNITLQSIYPIVQVDSIIETTIIHSEPLYAGIKINHGETAIINGFTIMNNSPLDLSGNAYACRDYAGGIYITNNSNIQILNCIVKNCSSQGAGGICFSGINFFMSNTKIYENIGLEFAGGVGVYGNTANSIIFDSTHPNSIYNNTARAGMDLAIWYLPNYPMQIYLTMFSVNITEPDSFFYSSDQNAGRPLIVQYAYFPLINHDLYVSPLGNNSNSGLSPDTPLQTIAYAVKIIEPDSLNPKTIHLSPGVYNFTESNQYFPFTIKSHTRLIGDSMDNTIFDTENSRRYYYGFSYQNDIRIENISFAPYISQTPPTGCGVCENIVFRNLKFSGVFGAPRIDMIYGNNIICENIIVSNATINDLNLAFRIYYCDNVYLNNIIVNNLTITGGIANYAGFYLMESDITLRNSIIANCSGYDVSPFGYQNIETAQSAYTLDMSNTLIINNNEYGSNLWSSAPVYMSNRYQRMKMTNCTIANNNGVNTRAVFIKGDCDINNSVFYNPSNLRDLVFKNVYNGYQHHPTISYSLLNHPYFASDSTMVTANNLMINTDPVFLGSIDTHYDITEPEYYQLSANSPCINSGTPDTLGLNLLAMDLAGNYRIWDGRIDMGCYEFGSTPVSIINPEYPPLPDKIVMSIYPNPVYISGNKGAYAFIEFTLPNKAKEPPLVEIFNIKGQKVKSMRLIESYNSMVHKAGLSNQVKQNGEFFSTVWNGKDDNNQKVCSGMYIIRVSSDGNSAYRKISLIK